VNDVEKLIQTFATRLRIPWSDDLSLPERQWFAVYPPEQERRVRHQVAGFRREVEAAGKTWNQIDLSDAFADWMARHDYRKAYFEDPELLVDDAFEPLREVVVGRVVDGLAHTTDDTLTAVVGAGSLFGFVHLSQVFNPSTIQFKGRLLLLFPGNHEGATFNLLNFRSSYTYQAVAITAASSRGTR
jgi:hypothetical protein